MVRFENYKIYLFIKKIPPTSTCKKTPVQGSQSLKNILPGHNNIRNCKSKQAEDTSNQEQLKINYRLKRTPKSHCSRKSKGCRTLLKYGLLLRHQARRSFGQKYKINKYSQGFLQRLHSRHGSIGTEYTMHKHDSSCLQRFYN